MRIDKDEASQQDEMRLDDKRSDQMREKCRSDQKKSAEEKTRTNPKK